MPISRKPVSVKRPPDKKVHKSGKKPKVEKIEKLPSKLKKDVGQGSHKANSHSALELFSQVAELAKELVQDGSQEYEAMLAQKATENVGESADDHQNVEDALNQGVETPSEDVRVEENTELQAQNVDDIQHFWK